MRIERKKIEKLRPALYDLSGECDYLKLEELFSEFFFDELSATDFDDDEIQKITSMVFDDNDDMDESDNKSLAESSNEDEHSGISSHEKPFKLYISFKRSKQAEEFLESEGFTQRFKDGKKRVLTRKEGIANEDSKTTNIRAKSCGVQSSPRAKRWRYAIRTSESDNIDIREC